MKRGLRATATLPVLGLMLTGCGSDGQATEQGDQVVAERTATVRTELVEAEQVSDMAVFSADLLPMRRATLAAEVPGRVEEIRVELGERVGKGQTLVRIDTRALRQQVAEAEALFTQAQDRFERAEKLFAKRSITKEQHIDAVASRDVAEARLSSVRLSMEKSEVKAPWAGHVAAKRAPPPSRITPMPPFETALSPAPMPCDHPS